MTSTQKTPLDPAAVPDELVVFIHIFKAAGTSIAAQLRVHFGTDHVYQVNDGYDRGIAFEERLPKTLAQAGLSALTGHFQYCRIAPLLAELTRRPTKFFSFVRDPLDRLVSAYNYLHMTPDERFHDEARAMNLEQFYRFIVDNDPEVCVNHQCRYLSQTGEATFEAAAANIQKNLAFVGTTDGISQTSVQTQSRLGFALGGQIRLNAAERVVNLPALPDATRDFLKSITAEDQKLYDMVKRGQLIAQPTALDPVQTKAVTHFQRRTLPMPDQIKFPESYYVIDVGMHDGADSIYYARRGFKVIAFEANPVLAKAGQDKFAESGLDIAVRNLAISDKAPQKVKFYVNNERPHYSSLDSALGTRDSSATEIEVSSCSLADELASLGDRIYMVKIDIEGYDYVAVKQLSLLRHKPPYISVENGGVYFVNLMSEMGYQKFKFANQKFNSVQRVPPNSKHGHPVQSTFLPHSSGPFGDDLPGRWLTKTEALKVGEALELARKAAPDNLFAEAVGWFDMHAAM